MSIVLILVHVLLILNSIDKEMPFAIQMETIRTSDDAYC